MRNINSNKIYSKYFSKNPDEIRGKHIKDLLSENIFMQIEPYLRQVLEGRHVQFEQSTPHVDGTIHHTLATYLPNISEGKVVNFVTVVMDITEFKNLDLQRQILEAQLAESSRLSALGEMAGGVAHEVNNPLAIIRGKTGILKQRLLEGQLDKVNGLRDFGVIEATVDRIAKIVKGLRTYSRNSENDPFENSNLRDIIDDTIELCAEKLKAGTIQMTLECDPNIEVPCHPAQISQVLMNLIMNAYDAIAELHEKWIKIYVTEDQNNIAINVSDSGLGIPTEVANKIMQPFFTTKNIGKGTGLGLSISMGIVEAHGGNLKYLTSEKNTTFCLKIPKIQDQNIKVTK
ncbi:MAG: ATP-binding protein [Pseudobdellovibrio sp.]